MYSRPSNPKAAELAAKLPAPPPAPELYLRLQKVGGDEKAARQIIISHNAISSELLRQVNASFREVAHELSHLTEVLALLGIQNTASIVLGLELFGLVRRDDPRSTFAEDLWNHSQQVAQGARRMADVAAPENSIAQDAFAAGLVHDYGKLVLLSYFPEEFEKARALAAARGIEDWQAETEIFGASHAEVGAQLLQGWGVREPIVQAVEQHHDPSHAFPSQFTASIAVHLAENFLDRNGRDLNYPAELDLAWRLELFRGIVQSKPQDHSPAPLVFRDTPSAPPPPEPVFANSNTSVTSASFTFKDAALESRKNKTAFHQTAPLTQAALKPQNREEPAASRTRTGRSLLLALVMMALAAGALFTWQNEARDLLSRLFKREQQAAPPKTTNNPAFAHLRLQGIMFNDSRSSVIINGKSLRLGDQIEGARIVGIQAHEVVVEKDGARGLLQMK